MVSSTLKITYPNKFLEADTRPMADWQNWKQTNSRSNANWHHSAYPWVYWCDLSLVSALQCDWTIQVWYEGREDLWKEYERNMSQCIWGPIHICSRYMTPAKCSRNKFSVHERSDCEHCEMFSVPLRSDLKSAHISVCAVWLIVYTLRNMWGHFNVHSPCW